MKKKRFQDLTLIAIVIFLILQVLQGGARRVRGPGGLGRRREARRRAGRSCGDLEGRDPGEEADQHPQSPHQARSAAGENE